MGERPGLKQGRGEWHGAEEFLKIVVPDSEALQRVLARLSKVAGPELKDPSAQWGAAVKAASAEFERLARASK